MKTLLLLILSVSVFLFGCKNNSSSSSQADKSVQTSSTEKDGFYFDYTLDGKEMHVDAEDISSTYYPDQNNRFAIFAGKDGAITLLLTVSQDMTKGSVTPSGSSDPNMNIQQGSVSLQNYPEKNYTSNSYNSTYPEKTPVIADAITITASEKDGEEARIITGTFNAKTYGDNTATDPKSTDHVIKGKFRIRHVFTSYNGGKF